MNSNGFNLIAFCSGLAFFGLLMFGDSSNPYGAPIAMGLMLLSVFSLFLSNLSQMQIFNQGRFRSWLEKKEIVELRTINLKMLATEFGLAFFKDNRELSRKLVILLGPIKTSKQKFKNFIEVDSEKGNCFLFDYPADLFTRRNYYPFTTDSKSLTGVSITNANLKIPEFVLARYTMQNHIQLKQESFLKSIDTGHLQKLPKWLNSEKFMTLCTKKDEEAVEKFLSDNPSLEFFIEEPSFRLLSFKEGIGAAFFNKKLESDGSNFMQFKRFALRMLELKGEQFE